MYRSREESKTAGPFRNLLLPHQRLTRIRKIVFRILAVLFIISVPVLLAFAFGFQYETDAGNQIVETAAVKIASAPEGIAAVLGGEPSQQTPAVFSDLNAGMYGFSLSAEGALPWNGRVKAEKGQVISLPQVRMISAGPPKITGRIDGPVSDSDRLIIHSGRTLVLFKRGMKGEKGNIVSIPVSRTSWDPAVIPSPFPPSVRASSIQYIPLSDNLVVLGAQPDRNKKKGSIIRISDQVLFSQTVKEAPPPILMLPERTRAMLWAAGNGESAVVLEPDGIVRIDTSAPDTTLLQFEAPLYAYGFVHGKWYILDGAGNVYEYGRLSPPSRSGKVMIGDLNADPGTARGPRIIFADEGRIFCLNEANGMLLIYSKESSPERLAGITGGCPSNEKGGLWLWGGNELFYLKHGSVPVETAAFETGINGLSEEFCQHHAAVETEDGIYLLPLKPQDDPAVKFEPLQIYRNRENTDSTPCADGMILTRERQTGFLEVNRIGWYRE